MARSDRYGKEKESVTPKYQWDWQEFYAVGQDGEALFQLRDNSAPGSPERKAAVEAILEWTFDVQD